jgi:ATP-dependent Clp protease ATP-binding subunit ClpA
MPDPAEPIVPLATFMEASHGQEVVQLVELISDVALRLDHHILAVEHLMVVGAENGVEEMARHVPGLSAFREALLDSLFDDREQFQYGAAEGEEQMQISTSLANLLGRIDGGETCQDLMVEVMLGDSPRIARAVNYSRGREPDVIPPDTMTLERVLSATDAGQSAVLSEPEPELAHAHATTPPRHAADAPDVPLTENLGIEAADDPPLVGREALCDQVARILLRFHQPAVVVTGAAGSGKTAFVRGLASAALRGAMPSLDGYTFYKLKLLDLVAQSHRGQDLHNLVDQILAAISTNPKGVLVVDDLHLLVAKQGYPLMSDLIDTIKMHISKGNVRALLTVESSQFEKSFSIDPFFGSQVTVKQLSLLERDDLTQVARVYRPRLERHFDMSMADDALDAAVAASLSEEAPDYVPPGSIIRLLDEACAMARSENAETVEASHVQACFAQDEQATGHHDRTLLRGIEAGLSDRVLGQDLAAGVVGRRVRLAKMHLDRKPERPDGVFLFMGPSGVGKTEMARSLARTLYGDESRLVRLDMSEYMEPHSVARIIGAPPGYVGYGEEGALTGPVSQLGHCVVLLDEIEKAHPRVLNLFLQVFDDGRLTDSKGRLVDFSDTVLIMTSNIGRELYAIHGSSPIGFGGKPDDVDAGQPVRDVVQDHLLRVLPSEFVNRIDEIVPFRVLDEDDISLIAEHLLAAEVERWKLRGKTVTFGPDVPRLIATSGYDPRLGARHVERNLERLVITVMSDAAVSDGFDDVQSLDLKVKDGAVCLNLDGEPFQCLTHDGRTTLEDGQD